MAQNLHSGRPIPGARPRRLGLALGLALGLGLVTAPAGGCATGAEKLARKGVQGGLGGALEALNDPVNQALMRRLMGDADIQQAAHDLSEAITGGALDGVSDDVRMQRVRAASDAYIRTIATAVGEALNEDISPAVTRGVSDVVGGTVAAALSPENARLARSFVDGVTRSTITAFMQSTSQGLRDELGPALNQVLERDLGPGLQRVVEDNLGPALSKVLERDLGPTLRKVMERDLQPMLAAAFGGEESGAAGVFTRGLTRQIVLGVNDGMSELGMSLSPNDRDGIGLIGWIPLVLGALLLILLVLLIRMFMTRRAVLQDRVRSEEMLVSILRAIKSDDDDDDEAPDAGPVFNAVIARARRHIPNLEGNEAYLANIINRAHLPAATGSARPSARKLAHGSVSDTQPQGSPRPRPPPA